LESLVISGWVGALSETELDCLFVDASHVKMHDGAPSEPVLVASGMATAGKPVFVQLDGVSAESTDAWVAFLESIVARGLAVTPVLVVSDGAPALCAAIDQVFPTARTDQDAVKADF
jgi:transposase-like protein